MPRFSKILSPVPRSRFILVRCPDCGNEQVVFSHSSLTVQCEICGRILAIPTGGKARIEAQVIRVLDRV
ncbi:MAG: 30S ribosomal protein S27e [Thermofilaceae archaeon]|nr:30S ribosomal protein S27e [Thermofilaceae archaeon]MCX8181062.1 30S ribosomal protein S27e [Thermofilaceae archaeon]MDW8004543.1 30S ribosomal protein S27e [Thermofilaceae archaeon]